MRWLLGLVGVGMMTSRALGAPEAEVLQLWIDDHARGDALVLVDQEHGGDVLVQADDLCAVRLCRAGGVEREGKRYLSLTSLAPLVRYRLDLESGELRIVVSVDAVDPTIISMQEQRPRKIEMKHATSMFLNYSVIGDVRAGNVAERATIASAFDAGVSVGGTLLHSTAMVTPDHAVRGLSTYTVDLPEQMVQVVVGDAFVSTGTLGGGSVIGGLHVGRSLELDPYFVAAPSLTYSGGVSTPSTVEIYRDGQLVRRELIPPGPFRVQDLTRGATSDARVVVRDAFGLTRLMATTAAPPATSLRAGFSMYDYSIGYARHMLATDSFNYGGLAALGSYRRGLTNRITAGIRAEQSGSVISGGGSLVGFVGHLAVEGQVAASRSDGVASTAGAVTVAYHHRALTFAAAVRAVGKQYATIDLEPFADRARISGDFNATWSMNSNVTYGAQLAYEHWRDSGDRGHAGLTGGFALGEARVFASLGVAHGEIGTTAEAMVTIAMSHGRHTTSSHSASSSTTEHARFSSTVSRALASGTGVGYQATVAVGDHKTAYGSATGQTSFGRADASAQWNDRDGGRATLALSGGIVAIGGTVKATRTVQGGYALVRVPDVAGVHAYLDNRLAGTTDSSGDLIIPDLEAFYGNRLRVDVVDLPIGVATNALERIIAPPRRGGVIVEFSAPPATMVRGSVVGRRGTTRVDLDFGELSVDGEEPVPIGRNGVFEVESLSSGRHHATVDVDGERCTFVIESSGLATIEEVGALACRFGGGR